MTVVFFVVSGLDLLQDGSLDKNEKEKITEWIYSMQLDNNKCLQETPGNKTLSNKMLLIIWS